jgi:hypothetical protein
MTRNFVGRSLAAIGLSLIMAVAQAQDLHAQQSQAQDFPSRPIRSGLRPAASPT